MFEQLKRLRIHPIQYGLVGVLLFLLLAAVMLGTRKVDYYSQSEATA